MQGSMPRSGGGAIAVQNAANASSNARGDDAITIKDLLIHIRRIIGFVLLAFAIYSPFGTRWINNPSSATLDGWDANRTSASWDTDLWDWDFIDCFYVRAH